MLSTHRTYLTAAALWRSAVIRAGGTGVTLRSTLCTTILRGKEGFASNPSPCRIPAASLTLDPSQREEGSP